MPETQYVPNPREEFDPSSRQLDCNCVPGSVEENPAVLLMGLTNYWNMDESSGSRAASYGTLSFSEIGTVGAVAGKDGNAADFGDLEGLQTASFALPLPYSIALWVFVATSAEEEVTILRQSDGSTNRSIMINGTDGTVIFIGGGVNDVNPGSIDFDVWNLIVVTVNAGGVIKASTNGETLVTGDTLAVNPGSGPLVVGRSINSPTPPVAVDSVFIFNTDLSQAQVAQLWNGGDGYFL